MQKNNPKIIINSLFLMKKILLISTKNFKKIIFDRNEAILSIIQTSTFSEFFLIFPYIIPVIKLYKILRKIFFITYK